jgi:hypothetical protein
MMAPASLLIMETPFTFCQLYYLSLSPHFSALYYGGLQMRVRYGTGSVSDLSIDQVVT